MVGGERSFRRWIEVAGSKVKAVRRQRGKEKVVPRKLSNEEGLHGCRRQQSYCRRSTDSNELYRHPEQWGY
jgi:hypothetical protein